jgi:hypothetical protein
VVMEMEHVQKDHIVLCFLMTQRVIVEEIKENF